MGTVGGEILPPLVPGDLATRGGNISRNSVDISSGAKYLGFKPIASSQLLSILGAASKRSKSVKKKLYGQFYAY